MAALSDCRGSPGACNDAGAKEHFAGYFFITVPDLDEANAWPRPAPFVTFSYRVPSMD